MPLTTPRLVFRASGSLAVAHDRRTVRVYSIGRPNGKESFIQAGLITIMEWRPRRDRCRSVPISARKPRPVVEVRMKPRRPEVPAPGSDEARLLGCLCSRAANRAARVRRASSASGAFTSCRGARCMPARTWDCRAPLRYGLAIPATSRRRAELESYGPIPCGTELVQIGKLPRGYSSRRRKLPRHTSLRASQPALGQC